MYCYNNSYAWNSVYFHEKDYLDNIYLMNYVYFMYTHGYEWWKCWWVEMNHFSIYNTWILLTVCG